MLNFEEELNKYKEAQGLEDLKERLSKIDITDFSDVTLDIIKELKKEREF